MSRRIAIFLPSLRGGGAERVGVTLANAFARAGHTIDLVLVAKEGPYLKEVDPAVRLVDLKARRVLRSFFKLVTYLRAERPDALFSTFHHASLFALYARRLARVATRIVVGAPNTLHVRTTTSDRILDRLVEYLVPKVYLSADAIIAVSHGVSADLCQSESRLKRSMHVIYNPVVDAEFLEKSRESVDHPWFAESRPILLAVGRLAVPKDYGTLLRAFALLRKSRAVRLLILGEGDERRALESLAKELGVDQDVALPGFVDNPFSLMARAAVYVMSSRTEGLPNALVQAMALGTRVVSTDCPSGPREILQDGKYGKLVDVGDVEGMARALADSLDESEPNIPDEAIAPFRVDTVAKQYLAVLVPDTC